MDPVTPPPFSGYYRGGSTSGRTDVANLKLLRQAYYGASWLMASTVGIGLGTQIIVVNAFPDRKENPLPALLALLFGLVVFLAVNFAVAFKNMSKVATAMNRAPGYAVGMALAATFVSPFCLGIFAAMIVQVAATTGFREFGIPVQLMSAKKRDIDRRIAELEGPEVVFEPPTSSGRPA